MPVVSIGTDIIATGTHGMVVSEADTTVILHPGVRIAISGSIGETGLYGNAAGVRFYLMGSVSGVIGVRSTMPDLTLTIGATGFVSGWVDAIGLSSTLNVISNAGTIAAYRGMMGDGQLFLTNTGTISANSYAILASGFADEVTNAGLITGGVELGDGNDLLDNSGGRIIGRINLWHGDDRLIGGDWAEVVGDGGGRDDIDLGGGNDTLVAAVDALGDDYAGGDGQDTLDLRAAISGTVVDLSLAVLRGGGFGTNLVDGFERVLGATGFSNRITGDSGANILAGGDRADTLLGGAGNDLIRTGQGANTADGNSGNDRIYGGDHGDRLLGGDGNDMIYGRYDVDAMTGGAGRDRFVFRDVEELFANTVSGDDRITDFTPGQDIIDLSDIDWNATGADNAFTFRGTGAITGPGQIAIRQAGGNTYVDIAWQTAGVADSIRLDGLLTLTANDFWL